MNVPPLFQRIKKQSSRKAFTTNAQLIFQRNTQLATTVIYYQKKRVGTPLGVGGFLKMRGLGQGDQCGQGRLVHILDMYWALPPLSSMR